MRRTRPAKKPDPNSDFVETAWLPTCDYPFPTAFSLLQTKKILDPLTPAVCTCIPNTHEEPLRTHALEQLVCTNRHVSRYIFQDISLSSEGRIGSPSEFQDLLYRNIHSSSNCGSSSSPDTGYCPIWFADIESLLHANISESMTALLRGRKTRFRRSLST